MLCDSTYMKCLQQTNLWRWKADEWLPETMRRGKSIKACDHSEYDQLSSNKYTVEAFKKEKEKLLWKQSPISLWLMSADYFWEVPAVCISLSAMMTEAMGWCKSCTSHESLCRNSRSARAASLTLSAQFWIPFTGQEMLGSVSFPREERECTGLGTRHAAEPVLPG